MGLIISPETAAAGTLTGTTLASNVVTSSLTALGTLTSPLIQSTAGALSAPPITGTGTWITGGTATTTKPYVLIEPTGATSTAWSTAGTGLGVNAASGFTGSLLDLQLNGVSKLSVSSAGVTTITGATIINAGLRVPAVTGGNGVSSQLSLQSTSGVGSSDFIAFYVGNNGATEAGRFVTSGRLGLGVTVPTGVLHLKAGTATASTAPLKFTTGTNLTTAEAGAMEYTDPLLYFTPTGTVRGVVMVSKSSRATAQTAANASVLTYTLPATDASFEVSANVLVTTSTLFNFLVQVDYTDEGNTARTETFNFSTIGGVISTILTNATGTVPYESLSLHIRCKASTAITVKTANGGGTNFTTVVYNVESSIRQIA